MNFIGPVVPAEPGGGTGIGGGFPSISGGIPHINDGLPF